MKKILFFIAVSLYQYTALAQWVPITDNSFASIYLNVQNLQIEGDIRRAWLLYDRKENSNNGESNSFRVLNEFNCKSRMQRRLQYTGLSGKMGRGDMLSNDKQIKKWVYIEPDTTMEFIFDVVCGA